MHALSRSQSAFCAAVGYVRGQYFSVHACRFGSQWQLDTWSQHFSSGYCTHGAFSHVAVCDHRHRASASHPPCVACRAWLHSFSTHIWSPAFGARVVPLAQGVRLARRLVRRRLVARRLHALRRVRRGVPLALLPQLVARVRRLRRALLVHALRVLRRVPRAPRVLALVLRPVVRADRLLAQVRRRVPLALVVRVLQAVRLRAVHRARVLTALQRHRVPLAVPQRGARRLRPDRGARGQRRRRRRRPPAPAPCRSRDVRPEDAVRVAEVVEHRVRLVDRHHQRVRVLRVRHHLLQRRQVVPVLRGRRHRPLQHDPEDLHPLRREHRPRRPQLVLVHDPPVRVQQQHLLPMLGRLLEHLPRELLRLLHPRLAPPLHPLVPRQVRLQLRQLPRQPPAPVRRPRRRALLAQRRDPRPRRRGRRAARTRRALRHPHPRVPLREGDPHRPAPVRRPHPRRRPLPRQRHLPHPVPQHLH
eukprot:Sspe_Gene.28039::Locus_12480_Transcript_1_1_Confidence_1.000_Length_1641::g.28039::m.28039